MLFATYYNNVLEQDRQQELVESRERYRTLSETVFEGIIDVKNGLIVKANLGFSTIFGYPETEILGQPLSKFVTDAANFINGIDQNEATHVVEMSGFTKQGVQLELEGVFRQYKLMDDDLCAVAIRDVTQHKQAEEALREAQRLDSLGVLTGGIAHDFNNMLTGILAQTSLAAAKLPQGSQAHGHINKAMKSAANAADLTKQLLVYAGKAQKEIATLDLNKLIHETATLVDATLPDTIDLEFSLLEKVLWVEGDTGQIQQVILNLILNGAEAIQPLRGQVHLTTSITTISQNQRQNVAYGQKPLEPGRYVCLSVSDTGSGMDDETKQHIFDPFFTTKENGHGLGLSSILGIVRTHHGLVSVDSEEEAGTTFTLLFPAVTQSREHQEIPMPTIRKSTSPSPLVLIVDDEEPVRDAVVEILDMAGIRTITAEDGHEGIQKYKEHRQDIGLTILDLKMPVMNGEETFTALQEIDPAAKVIFSSGYGEEEIVERMMQRGIEHVLQKPYDMYTLITTVRDVL
ncbi:response regulator [Chloroflexi bacterium TSY]|nr:response regulator [Chloroflexi bacterium TSY]